MIDIVDVREAENSISAGDERRVKQIIDGTIAAWERETNRLWSRRTDYVQTMRMWTPESRKRRVLRFELTPIETIELKEWQDGESPSDAEVLVEGEHYGLNKRAGLVDRIDSRLWDQNVVATITGGYLSARVSPFPSGAAVTPGDVREALIEQVRFSMKRMQGDRVAQQSQTFEQGQTNYLPGPFSIAFSSAVKTHRRRTFA